VALVAALLWIAAPRRHGVTTTKASPPVSVTQAPPTSAKLEASHAADLRPEPPAKTPADGAPQAQVESAANVPLALPVREAAFKHAAAKVTRRKFVNDVQAMTHIEDVAIKYGAPEKIVGSDSAVWRCADGDVIVKATNQPGQVMQNDGSWKAVDDFHIQAVSVLPRPRAGKDTR